MRTRGTLGEDRRCPDAHRNHGAYRRPVLPPALRRSLPRGRRGSSSSTMSGRVVGGPPGSGARRRAAWRGAAGESGRLAYGLDGAWFAGARMARRARQGATLDDLVRERRRANRRHRSGACYRFTRHAARRGRVGCVQHGSPAGWTPVHSSPSRTGCSWAPEVVRAASEAIEALAHKVELRAARLVDLAVLAAPPADTDDLTTRLSHLVPPERLHRSILGPVLGAYTGPGAIGVAWSTV